MYRDGPDESPTGHDDADPAHDGSGEPAAPGDRTPEEQLRAAEEEARQILEPLGSDAPSVDFTTNPIDPVAARAINDSLRGLVADYPDTIRQLDNIGSTDPANAFAPNDPTLAYALTSGNDQGVYVNPDEFGNAQDLADAGTQEESDGWTVPGGGGADGIFNHEFGHQLGEQLLNDPAALADLNRAVSDALGTSYDATQPHDAATKAALKNQLSDYGSTDPHEMMAEAFAEYRGADDPRPLARAIGGVMDQHLRAPETTPHEGTSEPAPGHDGQTSHDETSQTPHDSTPHAPHDDDSVQATPDDTPQTPHDGETPQGPHDDTPQAPHDGDTAQAPHDDTPQVPHDDTAQTPHDDTPPEDSSHDDAPPVPQDDAAQAPYDENTRPPDDARDDGTAPQEPDRTPTSDDDRPATQRPEEPAPAEAKPPADESHGGFGEEPRHGRPEEPGLHRRQDSSAENRAPGSEEHTEPEQHAPHDESLTPGDDGRLHREGDAPGTYRDDDGTLHRHGDSEGTYRSENGKLHFDGDPENTFRNDLTHRLHGEGGRFVDDPFTKRDIDYHHQEGERTEHDPSGPAADQLRDLAIERDALAAECDRLRSAMKVHQDALKPYRDKIAQREKDFRIDRPSDFSKAKLGPKILKLRTEIERDGSLTQEEKVAKQMQLQDLKQLAEKYNRRSPELVRLSERMGMAGAEDYVVNGRDGLLLTPRDDKPGTPGTLDVVGFSDDPPRLIVAEAKGGSSQLGSRLVENGLKAEQGSPEYLRWVLQRDPDLRAALADNPAVKARIEQALSDGTLKYEYHRVHVDPNGKVTHSEFGLDRNGKPFTSGVSGADSPTAHGGEPRPAADRSHDESQPRHDHASDEPRMRRRRPDAPSPEEPDDGSGPEKTNETGQATQTDHQAPDHPTTDHHDDGHTDDHSEHHPADHGGRSADAPHGAADPTSEAKASVSDHVGAVSPELSTVVNHLLDDPHQLNVTAALRDPVTREQTIAMIRELAEGEAVGPYAGDLRSFLADHPGAGPLFEPVPHEVNHDESGHSRKQDYVDHAKQADPARQVGREPTPEQQAQVRDYATRLKNDVEPAVRAEINRIIDGLGGDAGDGTTASVRTKDAAGLHDKVNRMTAGRPGAPGRSDYQVGDVIDAVGARITVRDMATLNALYDRIQSHYGVGDGGRILEIENMYAEPKAKAPEYRVIPMIVSTEVNGLPYTFELQLTTQRASIAADIEHNSIYKPYIPLTAAQTEAVARAMREAAALDQLETRGQDQ